MSSATSHLTPESLAASGRSAERLSLPALQSKMKCDPEGYESELLLLYRHFDSSRHLFQQQAALNFSSISGVGVDNTVSKDLADMAMFLAHVTPFYPTHLSEFPSHLARLLRSSARSLPSSLRCHLAQALILLVNRKMVDIGENLALFMELQTLGDRALQKLAFTHVIHSIRRMNQKHRNETQNRAIQNILFAMLQEEDESKAKRSLTVLCDLHRRKVWFDDRTANAICTACFHSSSRIMIASLSFLLGYENTQEDGDSEGSGSDDDATPQKPQVVLNREAIYKAHHKGTVASKKKKKAKLQRAIRSMKRQQRGLSENNSSNYYSPLNHLIDAQGFAEKLFSRLQTCNERFEVKMMMLKVIARAIGLHRLILLNFYPFLQKYVQPHQRDVTTLLAAAVQACHDMVPPDTVEPLFRQVVNQFIHDRSRTELMTEELLQDLVLYRKSHEKAVSTAARALITLFREVCPSLLVKKDRGRPIDPKARPKAFGEVNVASNVPGIELLRHNDDGEEDDDDEQQNLTDDGVSGDVCKVETGDEDNEIQQDEEQSQTDDSINEDVCEVEMEDDDDDEIHHYDDNVNEGDYDDNDGEDEDDDGEADEEEYDGFEECDDNDDDDKKKREKLESKAQKRKIMDYDEQHNAAETSLRALKRLAVAKTSNDTLDLTDDFLSNEDFQRIKELKASKEAKLTLARHGLLKKGSDAKPAAFKIPTSEELSLKRVDPSKLEINIRRKLSKEERLALVKAGREERGKYQARTAVKQKKTGGSSNRQKEHKKAMPLAAKRAKVARSREVKKKQQRRSGKQFSGRKAWK